MASVLLNGGFVVSPRDFCRIGRTRYRGLCSTTTRLTKLSNDRAILSVCYNTNAINVSLSSGYGSLYKVRVIPRTIRGTVRGTELGGLSGTRFVYTSTCRNTGVLARGNIHPSIMVLSPPQGNYRERVFSVVTKLKIGGVICVSYGDTALTESLRVLSRTKCGTGQLGTISLFPHAPRVRYITLVRGWGVWDGVVLVQGTLGGVGLGGSVVLNGVSNGSFTVTANGLSGSFGKVVGGGPATGCVFALLGARRARSDVITTVLGGCSTPRRIIHTSIHRIVRAVHGTNVLRRWAEDYYFSFTIQQVGVFTTVPVVPTTQGI